MSGLYNAALKRPAFASSVLRGYMGKHDFPPHLANDGNTGTAWLDDGIALCFCSNREDYPWWAVDLGQPMSVYRVDFTIVDTSSCMMNSIYLTYSYRFDQTILCLKNVHMHTVYIN